VNVEEESASLIIGREAKIFFVLIYLYLAANEAALLAAPDMIL
jgi:hypothetical protein